jgi:hypothetical protein
MGWAITAVDQHRVQWGRRRQPPLPASAAVFHSMGALKSLLWTCVGIPCWYLLHAVATAHGFGAATLALAVVGIGLTTIKLQQSGRRR